jgi:cytochrome c oxidase cbb3-type subunit 3
MSEETGNLIKDHEYDGIQELDNPLPSWWLMTFLGTIIFAFIYFIHYHSGTEQLISDEYAADVASLEQKRRTEPGAEGIDLAALLAMSKDAAAVSKGQSRFQTLCAACHGAKGQGGIGPNLTDKFWLHGRGELKDIATVVQSGVLDKGMPAWSTILKNEEIFQVVGFVNSLKGTTPADGKAPQGIEVK